MMRLDNASVALAEHQAADHDDSARKAKWLYEAIARLDAPLRETVLLILGEELSHREAAEILGIAETTVSWRMHEVRKRLRLLLVSADG
jgi:RNA polymerase sigma-70 factor (ECF subfamily)